MNENKIENAVDLGMDLIEEVPEVTKVSGGSKILKGILFVTGVILVYEGGKWVFKKIYGVVKNAKNKNVVVDFDAFKEEE